MRGIVLVLLAGAASAQFLDNVDDVPQGSPFNDSRTENVDFADVDQDGDWDALFADGGEFQQDQNRIWINQGGLQGGRTGFFLDETEARCPDVLDQSRDIELADIDGDGDVDVHVSNVSSLVNQPCRFWVNTGGGYFVDETSTRWVGLGEPGSSIPPGLVLAEGGFIDFSVDSDFGDIDNDGDLDLVHSTYGSVFSALSPTRLFLNDGAGYFSELNPSGFQLAGASIEEGNPGLWCEGTQTHDTLNYTGLRCDIATSAIDVDLGDVDGDFDLDILLGARDERPRMFANRTDASGLAPATGDGSTIFRDVTGLVFPVGYAPGTGHYEQEMGDLDGDGDLDIYGVNWHSTSEGLHDKTLENVGGGIFGNLTVLPGTQTDAEEADFLDYDGDGDLDVFVASFFGQELLLRNDPGGPGFGLTNVSHLVPDVQVVTTDADAADLDGDGDTDLLVAVTSGLRNVYLENVTPGAADLTPPMVRVEAAADRIAGAGPTVVRAAVYDNAPYYVTWYNESWIEYEVDGGASLCVPARSSGGQVFRAELPGDLVGRVTYRAYSRDEHGNLGVSADAGYRACGLERFCSSTPSSTGFAARIEAFGACALAAGDLTLVAGPAPEGQFGVFVAALTQVAGGAGSPLGNGLLCVGPTLMRFPVTAVAGGSMVHEVDFDAFPASSFTPGTTWHVQAWFRDPQAGGAALDSSDALSIPWE